MNDSVESEALVIPRSNGSPTAGRLPAAITFSFELAHQLGARHGFAEKNPRYDEKEPGKEPKFLWKRFGIPRGARVLQAEELITTTGTTFDVRDAVKCGNPHEVFFLPDIACGIFRPPHDGAMTAISDIIYLAKKVVKTWPPSECPLCKQGSLRMKPKENWAELTGKK